MTNVEVKQLTPSYYSGKESNEPYLNVINNHYGAIGVWTNRCDNQPIYLISDIRENGYYLGLIAFADQECADLWEKNSKEFYKILMRF
jgi:hypothetical protein